MENEKPKDTTEDILDLEIGAPVVAIDEPSNEPLSEPEPDVQTETPVSTTTATVYKGAGIRWGLLGVLILAVFITVLAVQNTNTVEFSFFALKISTPLSAIILGSAVVAVVIDELAGWVWGMRRRRSLRHKAELKQFKSEQEPEKTSRFGRS